MAPEHHSTLSHVSKRIHNATCDFHIRLVEPTMHRRFESISLDDITIGIRAGLADIGTCLQRISGKGYACDRVGGMTWEQFYSSQFAGYGLEPIVLFGEYTWGRLQQRWIIFLSATLGLLQYNCDGQYPSVISGTLNPEDIYIALTQRKDYYLDGSGIVLDPSDKTPVNIAELLATADSLEPSDDEKIDVS